MGNDDEKNAHIARRSRLVRSAYRELECFWSRIYIIKGVMSVYLSVCLFVCLSVANGRPNGWADQDKTWHGTHVDPGSVLVKVKVKVMWCHLVNANETPDRGAQAPREFEREAR